MTAMLLSRWNLAYELTRCGILFTLYAMRTASKVVARGPSSWFEQQLPR
jgi:hypothetical protein